jgi:hypothetical protein
MTTDIVVFSNEDSHIEMFRKVESNGKTWYSLHIANLRLSVFPAPEHQQFYASLYEWVNFPSPPEDFSPEVHFARTIAQHQGGEKFGEKDGGK